MKRIIILAVALVSLVSMVMNSCENYLPQDVQGQLEGKQEEAKDKISSEMKEAFAQQMNEFFQSSDLEESLGFSEEQLEEARQIISQYIDDYEFDDEELSKRMEKVKLLFDENQELSKEEIQKKLDEMLE